MYNRIPGDLSNEGKLQSNNIAQESITEEINPDLKSRQRKKGTRPGDSYIKRIRPYSRLFHGAKGHLVATPRTYTAYSNYGRIFQAVKAVLIGRPLFSQEEVHERLSKIKALPIFGSDAISSSTYATEAAMAVLVVAGSTALSISFYLALGIAVLLAIVAFSYRQIVYTYPSGGGAYNVTRQNLGQIAGLVAAAALLIDYVMTVAVSIAAGSLAVTSAIIAAGHGDQILVINGVLPSFLNVNVLLGLFFIGLIALGNLRGVRESGSIFSIPTYLFMFGLAVLLLVGIVKTITHTLNPVTNSPALPILQPLSIWLVLRAFSAGAVAMSGTEAISNGVPSFKRPEARNAAFTLSVMAVLLGIFFVGVSYLATHMDIIPGNQSVISQVAMGVFGNNVFLYIFQIATMGILVVAANTAFAGFPRLSSVLAKDNFMPHGFLHQGDRLAFSTGIIFLGSLAAFLLVLFRGNVNNLIHLYAVGVFLAFSMSNTGMVVHWWKTRGRGWKTSIFINALAAVLTGAVLIIVTVTKFTLGAWVVIILIPILIPMFFFIHRHYAHVATQLRITRLPPSMMTTQFVIVPIDDVNYASLRAISFARTQCNEIIVLHVAADVADIEKVQQKMKKYAPDLKFVIVESPLRSVVPPLLAYVKALHEQHPKAFISIILPEFVPAHSWERFLHNRTADQLIRSFRKHPNVAVILVPYLLEE